MLTMKELEAKYPKCFVGCIGACVGDGWLPLIEEACIVLEKYRSTDLNVSFGQIKEKFGDLRIYLEGENWDLPEFRKLDNEIEDILCRSRKICEACGSTENVEQTTSGWIKTYCKECAERTS